MNKLKYAILIFLGMIIDALLTGVMITPFTLSTMLFLNIIWKSLPTPLLLFSGLMVLLQGPYINIPALIGIFFLFLAWTSAQLLQKVLHPIGAVRFVFSLLFIVLYYYIGPGIPIDMAWWISTCFLLYGIIKYA